MREGVTLLLLIAGIGAAVGSFLAPRKPWGWICAAVTPPPFIALLWIIGLAPATMLGLVMAAIVVFNRCKTWHART